MLKIFSPTAILGYGFPEKTYYNALSEKPDIIAVDAGSTDPGPYYLGKGISFVDRNATKRDLYYLIKMALKFDIPILVGSSGGCGTKSSLDWTFDIVKEILGTENIKAKVAKIYSDIDKEIVRKAILGDKIKELDGSSKLTVEDLQNVNNIVAQIGISPFIEAYKKGVNIILAGRSYDPAPFSAIPIYKGYPKGLSYHLGKILECGAIAAEPGSGRDGLMGLIFEDRFEVYPLNEDRKCTVISVAAHTLYEKSDPYHLIGPDGVIDLTKSVFIQKDERTVSVMGSEFIESKDKWIKIEGAKYLGIRGVCIAGIRDPIMISQIDEILEKQKILLRENFKDLNKYEIFFHVYGKNGVMGSWEKEKNLSHELCIVIEVIGENQDHVKTILGFLRSSLLHYGYKNRISTAGNLAFPFSPSEVIWGEVFEFKIYHLIKLEDYEFPIEVVEV
ncbi:MULTISPECIES: acyclic terpene utilization AtuA family protein [Dictyoglomus]|jgi:hypothetical protein|uniref:Acyclic terpene utilisation N-terminal domain-containing protein n=1 Tax=Dictyoglomus turgidum (strain DSM 6724 / Z-1310) TaxID=515635 RepID=B8E0H2_DICTD|nr:MULTISPECIES: acyclic terpene utilization AtuA family protein [Dictyoglomus]ACK42617.1 conserved hypothetical protein [Dictyoglomus turgidum DSM 6724]PNV80499.1 MAG: acyclic terpene utilization AtuA family protein [Dictyoglomus turgidum]HBU31156.1 acyclic terpene utilization AtuA family protein [Dictyoglomus sp.]